MCFIMENHSFLTFPTSQAGKRSYTGKFVNIFLAFWRDDLNKSP